jgi:predicted esterase
LFAVQLPIKKDISGFARPLTINPQSQPHKQTIILLHGRGSNSTEFGPALLFKPLRAHRSRLHVNGGGGGSGDNSSNGNGSNNNNSKNNGNGRSIHNTSNSSPAAAFYHRRGSSITLRDALPHAKFILPTAVSLHAKALDGCAVNQWFDNWPLAAMVAAWNSGTSSSSYSSSESSQKDKDNDTLPIPGLQQTVRFLHDLIQTEIDELGGDAGGVVIGGFSQGSAASLIAALLWEGESLGAWVGMSGWMPFSRQIQQAAAEDEAAAAAADPNMALRRGVDKLMNILDVPVSSSAGDELDSRREVQIPIEHTPLFMAHGLKDDKAPIILGRMVRSCLESMHLDLQYKEYEHGEHECSEEALCDVVSFLWEKLRL